MNFITYIPETGEIQTYGRTDVPDVPVGAVLIENCAGTWETGYVLNGVFTAYTASQVAAKASPPSYTAAWSNSTFSWVDQRTLAEAQDETWEMIRTARDANQEAGFTWDGSKFDSDNVSVQRLQGALQLALLAQAAGQPFSIVWTLYDNTTRTLSGSDMIAVFAAMGTFVQNIFTQGVNLRNQINAATKLSDLSTITWQTIS